MPSRASNCTEVPAARANWAPLPGCSSIAWMVEPTGMLRKGRQLPGLMGASAPLINGLPVSTSTRRKDVAPFTVCVAQQCKVGGTVGVILKTFHLGRNAILVAAEIHQAIMLLVATALMTGGDMAIVVAA